MTDEAAGAKPNAAEGDAMLDALWGRVLESWDDDKPHQALLEYAITSQKLPDVAGRYRAIKEKDAARAERAQKKLDGIVIAATQMLMAMKTPEGQGKPSRLLTGVVFVVFIALLFWAMIVMMRHAR